MRKQTLSIVFILLVISGWNSYAFTESAVASTAPQQMMEEHCDHSPDNDKVMGCLEHCAALYTLPGSDELLLSKRSDLLKPGSASFKLIPELSSHWRPPGISS